MPGGRWISVEVYRGAVLPDATGGAVTSWAGELYVPLEDGPYREEEVSAERCLSVRERAGVEYFVPRLAAAYVNASGGRMMFGGNFVWSSDGRYRRRYGDRPVAVHDREES